MNKFCLNCGYIVKKDNTGGGSNADDSINKKYCSMHYKNGKFLSLPEINTAQKLQKYCSQEMNEDGINGVLAWILTRRVPRPERWMDT